MLRGDFSSAVVGAAGFLGSSLVRKLGREGIKCHGFTRATPFLVDGALSEGVRTADVIFWLVSSIRPATADDASDDLAGLRRLLERLADQARCAPRILVVSSGGTVYDTRLAPPYTEASPTAGVNAYGESMLAIENLITELSVDHVVLRASNAYGPGQPTRRGQGVIAHWMDWIRRGEPIQVIGDPATQRDYVYIDDLIDALFAAAVAPEPPEVLNIGSGTGTSLAELIELIPKIIGRSIEIEYRPSRRFDAPSTWLDVTLAKEKLGFEARVTLQEGLRQTWESLG